MEEITAYDPLSIVEMKVDNVSHIEVKNNNKCKTKCHNKPCTFICPSKVYYWEQTEQSLGVEYARCIECGACILVCPTNNIKWEYPRAGYGVQHKF